MKRDQALAKAHAGQVTAVKPQQVSAVKPDGPRRRELSDTEPAALGAVGRGGEYLEVTARREQQLGLCAHAPGRPKTQLF